jgi:hypothetical protein
VDWWTDYLFRFVSASEIIRKRIAMLFRGLGLGLLMVGLLSGCVSDEEKALRESLVRVEVAMEQGVSLIDYSLMVREVGTRYALAKPKLTGSADNAVSNAVQQLLSTQKSWQDNIVCRTRLLGIYNSSSVVEHMVESGKINEAHAYVQKQLTDAHCSEDDVKIALSATQVQVQEALKVLPAS